MSLTLSSEWATGLTSLQLFDFGPGTLKNFDSIFVKGGFPALQQMVINNVDLSGKGYPTGKGGEQCHQFKFAKIKSILCLVLDAILFHAQIRMLMGSALPDECDCILIMSSAHSALQSLPTLLVQPHNES